MWITRRASLAAIRAARPGASRSNGYPLASAWGLSTASLRASPAAFSSRRPAIRARISEASPATEVPPAAEASSEDMTATAEAEATEQLTATPRPSAAVPDTGIGALGAGVLGLILVFALIVVRRVRRAV